jgi:hypothetical protein
VEVSAAFDGGESGSSSKRGPVLERTNGGSNPMWPACRRERSSRDAKVVTDLGGMLVWG